MYLCLDRSLKNLRISSSFLLLRKLDFGCHNLSSCVSWRGKERTVSCYLNGVGNLAFVFTSFDQGVKFFSPLNAFPQFDDFMFHGAQWTWLCGLGSKFESTFCQPNVRFLSFAKVYRNSILHLFYSKHHLWCMCVSRSLKIIRTDMWYMSKLYIRYIGVCARS